MTPAERAAIRAREQAATPGPWRAMPNQGGVPNGVDLCLDPCVFAVVHSDAEPPNLAADTAFIAHARTDVPSLLAEVEALQAQVDTLGEGVHAWKQTAGAQAQRALDAQAAVAAVEAVRAIAQGWKDDGVFPLTHNHGEQILAALDGAGA